MHDTLNQNTVFEEKLNNSIDNINHINSLLKKQQKGGLNGNATEKIAIAAAARASDPSSGIEPPAIHTADKSGATSGATNEATTTHETIVSNHSSNNSNKIQQLEKKIKELENKEVQLLAEHRKALANRNSAHEEALRTALETRAAQLNNANAELRKEQNLVKHEQSNIEDQLKKRLAQLEREIGELRNSSASNISIITAKLDNSQSTINGLQESLEKKTKELGELRNQETNVLSVEKSDLQVARNQLSELQSELSQLKESKNYNQDLIRTKEAALNECMRNVGIINKKNEELQIIVDKLRAASTAAQKNNSIELQKHLQALSNKQENTIQKLREQESKDKEELAKLGKQLRESKEKNKINEAIASVIAVKQSNRDIQRDKELMDKNNEIRELKVIIDQQNLLLQSNQITIEENKKEIEQLTSKNKLLQKTLDSRQNTDSKNTVFTNQLKENSDTISDLRKQNHELRQQNDKLQARILELESELEKSVVNRDALNQRERKLNEKNAALNERERELNEKNAALEELQQQLNTREAEISHIKQQHTNTKHSESKINEKIELAERRLKEVTSAIIAVKNSGKNNQQERLDELIQKQESEQIVLNDYKRQLAEVKEQLGLLQEQLRQKTAENTRLRANIQELNTRIEELTSKYTALEFELENLRKENEKYLGQIRTLTQTKIKLEREIERLRLLHANKGENSSNVTNKMLRLTNELRSVNEELSQLKSENERLKSRIAELEKELNRDSTITTTQQDLESIKKERDNIIHEIEKHKKQLQTISAAIIAVKDTNSDKNKEELERLRNERKGFITKLKQLQLKLDASELSKSQEEAAKRKCLEEKNLLEAELGRLRAELETLKGREKELIEENRRINLVIESITKKVTNNCESIKADLQLKDQEIIDLKEEIRRLTVLIEELKQKHVDEKKGLQSQLDTCNKKNRALENEIKQLREQLKRLRRDKESIAKEIDILKKTSIRSLQEYNVKLKEATAALVAVQDIDTSHLQQKIRKLEEELQQLRNQPSDNKSQIRTLRIEIERLHKIIREKEETPSISPSAAASTKTEKCDELKGYIIELKQEIDRLRELINTLNRSPPKSSDQLTTLISTLIQKLEGSKTDKEDIVKLIKEQNRRIQQYESTLSELRAEIARLKSSSSSETSTPPQNLPENQVQFSTLLKQIKLLTQELKKAEQRESSIQPKLRETQEKRNEAERDIRNTSCCANDMTPIIDLLKKLIESQDTRGQTQEILKEIKEIIEKLPVSSKPHSNDRSSSSHMEPIIARLENLITLLITSKMNSGSVSGSSSTPIQNQSDYIDHLKKQITDLQEKLSAERAQYQELSRRQSTESSSTIPNLQQDLQNISQSINRLSNPTTDRREEIHRLNERIIRLEGNLEQKNKNNEQYNSKLSELNIQLARIEGEKNSTDKRIEDYIRIIHELKERHARLDEEVRGLRASQGRESTIPEISTLERFTQIFGDTNSNGKDKLSQILIKLQDIQPTKDNSELKSLIESIRETMVTKNEVIQEIQKVLTAFQPINQTQSDMKTRLEEIAKKIGGIPITGGSGNIETIDNKLDTLLDILTRNNGENGTSSKLSVELKEYISSVLRELKSDKIQKLDDIEADIKIIKNEIGTNRENHLHKKIADLESHITRFEGNVNSKLGELNTNISSKFDETNRILEEIQLLIPSKGEGDSGVRIIEKDSQLKGLIETLSQKIDGISSPILESITMNIADLKKLISQSGDSKVIIPQNYSEIITRIDKLEKSIKEIIPTKIPDYKGEFEDIMKRLNEALEKIKENDQNNSTDETKSENKSNIDLTVTLASITEMVRQLTQNPLYIDMSEISDRILEKITDVQSKKMGDIQLGDIPDNISQLQDEIKRLSEAIGNLNPSNTESTNTHQSIYDLLQEIRSKVSKEQTTLPNINELETKIVTLTRSIDQLIPNVITSDSMKSKIQPLITTIETLLTKLDSNKQESGDTVKVKELEEIIKTLQTRMTDLEQSIKPAENENIMRLFSSIKDDLKEIPSMTSIKTITESLAEINSTLTTLSQSQSNINDQNQRLSTIISRIEAIIQNIPQTNKNGSDAISSQTVTYLQSQIDGLKADLKTISDQGLSTKYDKIMELLTSIDSKKSEDIDKKLKTIIDELKDSISSQSNQNISSLIQSIRDLIASISTHSNGELQAFIAEIKSSIESLKIDEFNGKLQGLIGKLDSMNISENPADIKKTLENILKEIQPIKLSEADRELITQHTTAINQLIGHTPNKIPIDDTAIKDLIGHVTSLQEILGQTNGSVDYKEDIEDIKSKLQTLLNGKIPTFNNKEILDRLRQMETNIQDSIQNCTLTYSESINLIETEINDYNKIKEFLSQNKANQSEETKKQISDMMDERLLQALKAKYASQKDKLYKITCAYNTLKNPKQSETHIREIINHMSNNPENLKGDIASLKTELQKWKEEIIASKIKETVDITALKEGNTLLLTKSEEILSKQDADIADLKDLIGQLKSRLEMMSSEITDTKNELIQKIEELKNKTAEFDTLKQEKEDLQKQLEEAKREVEECKERLKKDANTGDKEGDSKSTEKETSTNSNGLTAQLEEARSRLAESEEKLKICQEKLNHKTTNTTSQNEERIKEFHVMEDQLRNLKDQIKDERLKKILSYDTRIDFPLFHIIVMFKKTIDLILLNPNNIKVDKDETDENEDKNTMIYKLKKIDDTFINKLELDSKLLEELSEFEKIKIPTIFSLQERMKLLICALLHVSPMERYKIIKKDIIENTPSKISNIKNFGRVYIHEMKEYEKYFGYKPNENINSKQKNYFANYLVGLNDMINIGIDILNEYYREMVSPQLLEEQIKTVVNYRISDEFIERLQKSGFSSKEQIRLCIIYILQNEYLSN